MMDKLYKIYFERSGGFAGLTLRVEILSDKLAKTDKDRLDTLMEKSDICNYKITRVADRDSPDQFDYLIRVTCDKEDKEFSFSDNTLPPNALPLVNYLIHLARWKNNQ